MADLEGVSLADAIRAKTRALEAGQWARAMEAAGCGEEADRG